MCLHRPRAAQTPVEETSKTVQQSERSTQWNSSIGTQLGLMQMNSITKEERSPISKGLGSQRKLHKGGISKLRSSPSGTQPFNEV